MKVLGETPLFLLGLSASDETARQRRIQSDLAIFEPSDPPESAETNNDEKARILTELILQFQSRKQSRERRRPKNSAFKRAFEGYDRTIDSDEVAQRRGLLFDRKF